MPHPYPHTLSLISHSPPRYRPLASVIVDNLASSKVQKWEERERERERREHTQFREIRADTRRRVRGFYAAGWRRSGESYGEAALLDELPVPLRAAVKREVGERMRTELVCLQVSPSPAATSSLPFSLCN